MDFFHGFNWGSVEWLNLSPTVLSLIALALVFDFLNGTNDAANSVATVVSTRVLTPGLAVVWAAFFNFAAFLIFPLAVARTIGTGTIDPGIVDDPLIAATLIGACVWVYACTHLGMPISVSHSLIGGMIGAALMKVGPEALNQKGITKIVLFIVLSPLIGFVLGLINAVVVTWLARRSSPRGVDRLFRVGQLLSAALYSLGHGGNDAQKTMGIIYVLLISSSYESGAGVLPRSAEIPTEVVLACHAAMGLGTLIGGWAVIHTLGLRVLKLRPVDGFCAEVGGASTLVLTLAGGIPASTTHTITGSIIGVGTARHRFSAVRWGVAVRIVWAWILTIPGASLIAALSWLVTSRWM